MSSVTSENGMIHAYSFAIHTLGCKVNSYESDKMAKLLTDAGFEMKQFDETADIYIVNTCSVTNIADRKSRQILHRAKKLNEEALIVAAGCYVESRQAKEILEDGVDVLIKNEDKDKIVFILTEYLDLKAQKDRETEACPDVYPADKETVTGHTRAYIKIQDGCNQFCTYCIIPYVRGRIKSRDLDAIIKEAEGLSEAGFKEVVLTGIHVSSYGRDMTGATDKEKRGPALNLLSVIKAVHRIEGIERIRLSSLEPGVVDEEFAKTLAGLSKVCPHFHLSLQSGCADTLKRMNRHYTPQGYADAVGCLREAFLEKRGAYPAITTDVITGFPGESAKDFEESRSFVESIGFFETHIFKYSKRQGTPAAKMKDQLTDRVKSERSGVLIALNEKKRAEYISSIINSENYIPSLLIEEEAEIEGQRLQVGYTAEYIRCGVKSGEDLRGRILKGRISLSDLSENGRQICIMEDFELQ